MNVGVAFGISAPSLIEHFGIAVIEVYMEIEHELAEKIGKNDTELMVQAVEVLNDFGVEQYTAYGFAFEVAKRMLATFGHDFRTVTVRYMNGLRLTIAAEAFAEEWLRRAGHSDYRINPLERVVTVFSAEKVS